MRPVLDLNAVASLVALPLALEFTHVLNPEALKHLLVLCLVDVGIDLIHLLLDAH